MKNIFSSRKVRNIGIAVLVFVSYIVLCVESNLRILEMFFDPFIMLLGIVLIIGLVTLAHRFGETEPFTGLLFIFMFYALLLLDGIGQWSNQAYMKDMFIRVPLALAAIWFGSVIATRANRKDSEETRQVYEKLDTDI